MRYGPAHADDRQLGNLIRFGTIAEVDLAAGLCVVACGEVRSGKIRWLEGRAGATRTWSPPGIGEQVLLLCPEGDIKGGVALRGISSSAHPPAGNGPRELVEFGDGTILAYDPEAHLLEILVADGEMKVSAPNGITLTGPVKVDGTLSVTDDVDVQGKVTASDDVLGGGKSLKSHKHGGVSAGGAFTQAPQ